MNDIHEAIASGLVDILNNSTDQHWSVELYSGVWSVGIPSPRTATMRQANEVLLLILVLRADAVELGYGGSIQFDYNDTELFDKIVIAVNKSLRGIHTFPGF